MLPSDRYLAQLLGLTDEQFMYFQAEVQRRAKEQPEPAVVAGLDPVTQLALASLIITVIGTGLQIAATFLKPSTSDARPAALKTPNIGGKARTENERFAPRYGFDSAQEITTLGAVVPIVYTLREAIGAETYGGVRVNTDLLWSQIYSLGGSQLLRAIFLIGEGPIASIDVNSFASGGNTLASYDYGSASSTGSRMAVYGRYDAADGLTTRINSTHHIFGRNPSTDKGNANSNDIFLVNGAASFSAASRPSNQTTFGVYGLIGNDFGYRINPTIKPIVQAQLIPEGDDGDAKVKCTIDDVAWVQKKKYQTIFSSRAAITSSGLGTLGGTTSYTLYPTSDKDTIYSRDVKSLQTPGDWVFSVETVSAKQGAGTFVKSINKGFAHYHDDTEDENSLVINNLADRISATITGVTVDAKGKGVLTANLSFNTGTVDGKTLKDSNDGDENLNEYLQTLKAVRFRLKWKNDLSVGDPEDDVVVRYPLQVLVKTKVKQQFTADGGSISEPTLNVTKDGDGKVTNVTISGGGGTISGLTTTQTFSDPLFKFKRTRQMTASSGKVSAGGTVTATVALEFNAKKAYIEKADDVASAIAGRQKTWDDNLIEGELYKIGSGLAVCDDRSPNSFVSEADISSGSGTAVTATFKTVRVGAVTTNTSSQAQIDGWTWNEGRPSVEWHSTATVDGHILRCAIASISTTRPCKTVQIGIRSRLGIRINGICNFKESLSFDKCDERACLDYKGDIVEKGSTLKTDIHQSNTISAPVERYSFFAIYYRAAGSTDGFTKLGNAYGVRGATQQNIFNYIELDMPTVRQWEFQIEPYSGWEVRNGGIGTLYVLDASLTTSQTVTDGSVTVRFTGTSVAHSEDVFSINVGRRRSAKESVGIPRSDTNYANGDYSYLDTWGKLAEAFIYEEVQSSASGGPEHEVVYINEIVPNSIAPLYDNLAILGLNIMSSVEWQQFGQFSCYVTGGKTCRRLRDSLTVGATHLFPDVLLDLMTNATYGAGDLITDNMIDLDAFRIAADWCYDRKYFFDGVQADRVNLRQWAADIAAAHLLNFGESDGKFYLRPALQFTAVSIKGLFTAGNIVEGSFKLQYLEPEEREPIQVSVRYREERASTDLTNPGIFPTEREVLVREATGSATDPVESIDLSDYVTSRKHAIDAAKFIIRMRRIPTHAISFRTTHEGALAKFGPSDYIRVAMDETQYDQFNNGVVTASGALISTKPLSDDSYAVIAWDGTEGSPPADTTLVVSGGGTTATPAGIIFTVKLPSTQVRTYQIERITPDEEGTFNIEAVHMPTNASGVLELADGFDTDGNWVIE